MRIKVVSFQIPKGLDTRFVVCPVKLLVIIELEEQETG